jgi:hypothetical protein
MDSRASGNADARLVLKWEHVAPGRGYVLNIEEIHT